MRGLSSSPFARRAARGARDRELVDIAGVAPRGDAKRQQHGPAGVSFEMPVRIPQTRHEGLALAIDHLRVLRYDDRARRADLGDQALVDHHGLPFDEALAIDERADVGECDRARWRPGELLHEPASRRCKRVVLHFLSTGCALS